jgi:hypothetical protein
MAVCTSSLQSWLDVMYMQMGEKEDICPKSKRMAYRFSFFHIYTAKKTNPHYTTRQS